MRPCMIARALLSSISPTSAGVRNRRPGGSCLPQKMQSEMALHKAVCPCVVSYALLAQRLEWFMTPVSSWWNLR